VTRCVYLLYEVKVHACLEYGGLGQNFTFLSFNVTGKLLALVSNKTGNVLRKTEARSRVIIAVQRQ
jgi:hypothetical protein